MVIALISYYRSSATRRSYLFCEDGFAPLPFGASEHLLAVTCESTCPFLRELNSSLALIRLGRRICFPGCARDRVFLEILCTTLGTQLLIFSNWQIVDCIIEVMVWNDKAMSLGPDGSSKESPRFLYHSDCVRVWSSSS